MPPETGWGGIGTYVDVLSEALASKGADVHVVSAVAGQPESRKVNAGVTVHRHGVPGTQQRPSRYMPETWRRVVQAVAVGRLITRLGLRPDVVECPEWMAEGLALSLPGRLPLVVRLHSCARQLFPISGQGRHLRGLDATVAAWLEETSARRAHVVTSTRANLEEVTGWMRLDPATLHAIPYPVRLPRPRPLPAAGAQPRVTFVGRLEPRKGPDILLAAAAKVLAALPDARFTFVGRDCVAPGERPSADWLRAQAARLGIGHAVEFTGQLDRAGVDEQIARATVCAFPSHWESFGNVVAEASAAGRPVVVSEIAGFRDVVQDGVTGRLVPLHDLDAWAAALIGLLGDRDQTRAFGEAGARHIAALSDPARVAELTLCAYEHAIERFRGERRGGSLARPARALT
jgi:glycosyltransferase involved in cell wall biosynthesis